jgi:hypothetical protein
MGMDKNSDLGRAIVCSAAVLFLLMCLPSSGFAQVVFQEGFEAGHGSWGVSNGGNASLESERLP